MYRIQRIAPLLPGTLDFKRIESAMGLTEGTLTRMSREKKEGAITAKLSKLQEMVHSETFMPLKPQVWRRSTGEEKVGWVENPDCQQLMEIKEDYGETVAAEVKRT